MIYRIYNRLFICKRDFRINLMSIENLIQAIFAGVCLNTGILHLMIGMRNQPRDRVHMAFASVSLLFGVYSTNLYFLNNALDSGSVTRFVAIDKWGVMTNYLAYAALFWFIAVYSEARRQRQHRIILAGQYNVCVHPRER